MGKCLLELYQKLGYMRFRWGILIWSSWWCWGVNTVMCPYCWAASLLGCGIHTSRYLLLTVDLKTLKSSCRLSWCVSIFQISEAWSQDSPSLYLALHVAAVTAHFLREVLDPGPNLGFSISSFALDANYLILLSNSKYCLCLFRSSHSEWHGALPKSS